MKRDSRNADLTTNSITSANIAGATEAVLAKLPKLETVRRDVRRQCAVAIGYPPISETSNLR